MRSMKQAVMCPMEFRPPAPFPPSPRPWRREAAGVMAGAAAFRLGPEVREASAGPPVFVGLPVGRHLAEARGDVKPGSRSALQWPGCCGVDRRDVDHLAAGVGPSWARGCVNNGHGIAPAGQVLGSPCPRRLEGPFGAAASRPCRPKARASGATFGPGLGADVACQFPGNQLACCLHRCWEGVW